MLNGCLTRQQNCFVLKIKEERIGVLIRFEPVEVCDEQAWEFDSPLFRQIWKVIRDGDRDRLLNESCQKCAFGSIPIPSAKFNWLSLNR